MAKNQTVSVARDQVVSCYTGLVRTADTVFSKVNSSLSRYQISHTQFATLRAIKLHGPLSQRDIGRFILKTGGNVTVVVDQLEAQGLVSRLRDSEDRRVSYVNLTPKGQKFVDAIYPAYQESIHTSMARLSEHEQQLLTELLVKLCPPEGLNASLG